MKKLLFSFVFLLTISFTTLAQTVRYVDNNTGAPNSAGLNYSTIQAAVDASSAGDIIYVQPSPNNYGNISMNKTLHIYGIGHNPVLNAGQYAIFNDIHFLASAASSTISGLNVRDFYLHYTAGNNDGILISNNRIRQAVRGNNSTGYSADIVVSGNYFQNNSHYHINNVNSQNWIISNNTFERSSTGSNSYIFYRLNNTTVLNNNIILTRQNGDGNQSINIFNACSGTQISNNIFIFTGNSVSNMNLGGNSALTFNNNLTYSVTTVLDPLGGTNIDDTNPLFTSFSPNNSLNNTTHDYTFQGGSLAINAGSDGNDLGVMNGGFPFNVRGYPTELPYLTDFVIFNNILSEGTDLNINVKANANNN
ncbi:hypothetical protein [Seonamhaeicola maritimus]|uniref:hypothetical protein n=1 Tax=Seonamhaeicola maritimus TaxID=2591822 RepID=UPI002494581D|nr:hypothetical protein [Seonamhaeicola maritimus]